MDAAALSWVEHIRRVATSVGDAARDAGRDPGTVTIVAVTKTQPPTAVEAAVAAGLPDVGENYVQEGRDKRAATRAEARWHLIGGLQRNKVRTTVRVFDRVHTLCDTRVATALDAAAGAEGRRLPVCVQVRTADDATRPGLPPGEVCAFTRALLELSNLHVDGLMAMPPAGLGPEQARLHFRTVRQLRDETANALGVELPHLSMGMSGDFSVAIAEGATMVRLGRELFGERGLRPWREDA